MSDVHHHSHFAREAHGLLVNFRRSRFDETAIHSSHIAAYAFAAYGALMPAPSLSRPAYSPRRFGLLPFRLIACQESYHFPDTPACHAQPRFLRTPGQLSTTIAPAGAQGRSATRRMLDGDRKRYLMLPDGASGLFEARRFA